MGVGSYGAGWRQTLTKSNYSMLSHVDLMILSVLIEYEVIREKVKLYDEANVKHTNEIFFFSEAPSAFNEC
jgi:hypothetical protein